MEPKHRDLYAEVTARIVQTLEKGVRPWSCPWTRSSTGGILPRRHTGEAYKGVNVLLLWATTLERGYTAQTWITYQQVLAKGGQVRKGERGTTVVYAGQIATDAKQADANEDVAAPSRMRGYLKSYTVFNVEQCDGLPVNEGPETVSVQPLEQSVRTFIADTGATIRHGGDRAFYAPSADVIQLPHAHQFRDPRAYVGTVAHELVHWTGHPDRLARQFGQRFGDHAYAMEELVAELGAAFVCARLDVSTEPREDHAAYLAEWMAVLKSDKRALFSAASQAQRAADFLHEQQKMAEAA